MREGPVDPCGLESAKRVGRELLNHQHVGLVVGDGGDRVRIRTAVQHVDRHHPDGDGRCVGFGGDVERDLHRDRDDGQTRGDCTEQPTSTPQQHDERHRGSDQKKRCGDCRVQPHVGGQWGVAHCEGGPGDGQQQNADDGAGHSSGGVHRTP